MCETVIKVENLSKQYRIGGVRGDLLSERLGNGLRSVFRRILGNGASDVKHNTSNLKPDKDFWALRDVFFEVKEGEVVGIIGRNGAGKSTFLKILSKITSPTSGRVELLGRVASLLEVGTGFHPELTGRENIFLNGAILGMSKSEIRKKFDEIVAFAEIEKFVDTPVKHYSSGMYVRLAFAVAAHLEPEILIVDEVLAVGDVQFQKKCLGKMGEVARGGRTVLYVSHNMASIKRLCTSVLWLHKGRIFDIGVPYSVIGKYLQENLMTDASVVISDYQHVVKSFFQIKSVEIMNSARQPSAMIFFNEDIYIKLGVHAAEDVSQARVGIGICTDGIRLSTVHTPPLDFRKSVDHQYIFCKIKGNSLLPNHYSLQLGAYSSESGHALDWVVDAASFSIAAVSNGVKAEFDEKDMGLVRIDVEWDVAPLSR